MFCRETSDKKLNIIPRKKQWGFKDKMSLLHTIRSMLNFILHFLIDIIRNILRIFILLKYQMKDVSGKIAFVTGAGGELGRSLALGLANLGVIVVIWDINQKDFPTTKYLCYEFDGFGIEKTMKLLVVFATVVCDLCNREDIYKTAALLRKEVGKVTILINNAGVINIRKFWKTPDNLLTRTMNVNIMSHFWTVKAFLPGMIESNKGHILGSHRVASGHIGFPNSVEYCTLKYAVVGFNEALQMELMYLYLLLKIPVDGYERYNINTTVVCPYFIHSTGISIDGYSRFLPTLSPKEVAEKIITSLQCNKKDVSLTYAPIEKSSINGIKTNITMKIQDDGAKHQ
ncbi:short-chain dehydrogenase/reductase family 16C member 6 isoform X1 [Vespula maculifrons]|uniref:Short-chain dehydrogenase/reductase family 16C member 6 isoform X1 n=2 Tax=Vespula maculifrons TaxID=7453 RepID=A0ABD2AP74_VESMC